jgi:hypothetical protein
MLNSGKKIYASRDKKNILTLVLSEKKFLNETKNHNPHIRFLPSIVAEKNGPKNEHISSMCIKINQVGKQKVGI